MSYFPTDIPFMSDDELIENGLKKPKIIKGTDLVPVVRCRDCKYYEGRRWCGLNETDFDPDDFCSYGEKKE